MMAGVVKAGKYAECNQGRTWLVLAIRGDKARVEDVISKQVYWAPLTDLTRATMIEDVA